MRCNLLIAIADCCVYENISVSASVTCNLLARRVQIKTTADQWIDFKKSWGTNRQSELRGVATGGFPSVCVKARTKARSSSRRSSTTTNHQTKIATKINLQLSSSRRLIMLQKSSSAHGLRAYYHSFLPVQIKCHTVRHIKLYGSDN